MVYYNLYKYSHKNTLMACVNIDVQKTQNFKNYLGTTVKTARCSDTHTHTYI